MNICFIYTQILYKISAFLEIFFAVSNVHFQAPEILNAIFWYYFLISWYYMEFFHCFFTLSWQLPVKTLVLISVEQRGVANKHIKRNLFFNASLQMRLALLLFFFWNILSMSPWKWQLLIKMPGKPSKCLRFSFMKQVLLLLCHRAGTGDKGWQQG